MTSGELPPCGLTAFLNVMLGPLPGLVKARGVIKAKGVRTILHL